MPVDPVRVRSRSGGRGDPAGGLLRASWRRTVRQATRTCRTA